MKKSHGGVTWRSVVLGLLLGGGLCALTPYNDYIVKNTFIAGSHLPIGAVAVLFLLALLNLAIYRIRGRALLHLREIAVIYIIIMVTSGIPGLGLLGYLTPILTICHYSATPGNRWAELFWDHIPPWMTVSDETAFRGYYEGLPAGVPIPWGAWWLPMSRWSILIAAIWLMMICLAALVRKQWADRERLAFPLVQFPLEVLRDEVLLFEITKDLKSLQDVSEEEYSRRSEFTSATRDLKFGMLSAGFEFGGIPFEAYTRSTIGKMAGP